MSKLEEGPSSASSTSGQDTVDVGLTSDLPQGASLLCPRCGESFPVSVDGRWTRFALSRRAGHDPFYVCSACGSDEAAVDRYVNQLCEALIVAVVEAAEEHRTAEEYGGPWWSSSERFIKAVQGDLDELLRVQAMQREVIYRLSGYPLRTSLESPEFQD